MQNHTKSKVTINARVFRARKDKPWFVPGFIWALAKKYRLPFSGTWHDLGEIASSERRTASVN